MWWVQLDDEFLTDSTELQPDYRADVPAILILDTAIAHSQYATITEFADHSTLSINFKSVDIWAFEKISKRIKERLYVRYLWEGLSHEILS